MRAWAAGLGFLGGVLVCVIVFSETAGALLGFRLDPLRLTPIEWWPVLAAVLVIGLKLLLIPLDPTLFGWAGPAGLIVAGELTGLVLLWWLGVEHSPLRRGLPGAGDYYPLVTAIATLVIADRNRFTPWPGLARLTSPLVLVLPLVSSAMTLGRVDATTVFTLALVAMALVIWAISQGELQSAILGGVAWLSAGAVAGLVVDQRYGLTAIDSRAIGAAVGILVAIYTLWACGMAQAADGPFPRGRTLKRSWSASGSPGRCSPRAWSPLPPYRVPWRCGPPMPGSARYWRSPCSSSCSSRGGGRSGWSTLHRLRSWGRMRSFGWPIRFPSPATRSC